MTKFDNDVTSHKGRGHYLPDQNRL